MNINDIKAEIDKLKNADTNWQNIEKLSMLFNVYNNLTTKGETVVKNEINTIPVYNDGEFEKAISNSNVDKLVPILSEHFSVVKVLHPKEYNAVIEKIKENSK